MCGRAISGIDVGGSAGGGGARDGTVARGSTARGTLTAGDFGQGCNRRGCGRHSWAPPRSSAGAQATAGRSGGGPVRPRRGPRPTPSTSKPPSTRTTALYRPGRDGAPKPTWPDARSPSPTGCSKPAATAPGRPSGPSSPGKPAPCSTRCFEPNGTVPPGPVRQANGNNLSPGPTLRPGDRCRASTCSAGGPPSGETPSRSLPAATETRPLPRPYRAE